MNIVTAVSRELRSTSSVMAVVDEIGKHLVPGDVDGTGLVKVGIQLMGTWHLNMQTTKQPRLRLVVAADASRTDGKKTVDNAYDRAYAAWLAIDAVMHRPTHEAVVWGGEGGALILGSNRGNEPSPTERPDASSAFLTCSYNIKTL